MENHMGRFRRRKDLNISSSAFSLAKGRELISDDHYGVTQANGITVAVLCDGVGSAMAGGEAAKRVAEHILNNFSVRPKSWSIEKSIKNFISSINSILYHESMNAYEREELLTTLVLAVIEGDRLYGANVGDSRVYLCRNGSLTQLSHDHTQEKNGHVLTRAIGAQKEVEPYYFENIVSKGDKILLCSDGLYNTLDDRFLKENIHLGAHSLVKKASRLTNDDLSDDTSAIVLDIIKTDEMAVLKEQNIRIADSLKTKQLIDGFELARPFNECTWLASKKGEEYVLKFAPPQAADNDEVLDLYIKEAWNAKRLNSPLFAKAVIPKNRAYRYYVMEYVCGETLQSLISHKSISIDDSVKLGKTLLAMSQYLLGHDLVHGDIKPLNIMVVNENGENNFKIVDFGNITEIFSISSKAGTPSFLSPERFQNESISESSEIFSIGVTLYIALTKRYPYGEIEPFQTPVFKEAKKPSFYNKNIPAWLDSVILRAIASKSDKRYCHYSHMMYELENPQKVEPYFSNSSSLLQRHELTFYKAAFIIMTIINIILFVHMNL